MVHRGQRWDNMGGDGKSKTLAALLEDSTETFPASSDTYRRPPESPQAHFVRGFYSCFVLANNLWAYFRAPPAIKCNQTPAWPQRPVRAGKTARQPVSRVLSAPCGTGRPFLWDASYNAPHATNPSGGTGTPRRLSRYRDIAASPIRSCSRWGLPCRPCYQGRGALLPHRFALAQGTGEPVLLGRFVFCGTVPGVAPAGR